MSGSGRAEPRWRPHVRHAAWLAVALAIAGCGGVELARPQPPPRGVMWGYFSDADIVLGRRALTYTSSKIKCELARRRDVRNAPCVQIVVGPGSDYYAVGLPMEFGASLPDGAIAATERERCVNYRTHYMQTYKVLGDCEPIGIRYVE